MLDLSSLTQPIDAILAPPELSLPMQPISCAALSSAWWHEELCARKELCATESLALGHSVAVVPGFASTAECEKLTSMATKLAQDPPPQLTGDDASLTAGRLRLPAASWPDSAARALSDALVRRALAFAREQLPSLAEERFGPPEPKGPPPLLFSHGEPAVNVYREGGQFQPHEDLQSLTVLVSLCDPGAYGGGGTAFWSEEVRGAAREAGPPSLVLRPAAGTALLFVGSVTHAGLPVISGTRHVFVASFSSQRGYKPHAHGALQGEGAPSAGAEPPGAREAALRLCAQEGRRRGEQWADEGPRGAHSLLPRAFFLFCCVYFLLSLSELSKEKVRLFSPPVNLTPVFFK